MMESREVLARTSSVHWCYMCWDFAPVTISFAPWHPVHSHFPTGHCLSCKERLRAKSRVLLL